MKKILIVDDNPAERFLIKKALEGEECMLFEAEDGFEAMKILNQVSPDILTLDLIMPGINGIDSFIAIRRLEKYKSLKIIITSGLDPQYINLPSGFTYLSKPISKEDLIKEIGDENNG